MTYVCTEKATISEWLKEIEELKEEVKKWRAIADENEIMLEDRKKVHKENKCLKARVETLEMWLDTKEKLNEEYRKQIDKLKTDNIDYIVNEN